MDMSIGVLIAFRRTSAFGLIAGIVASLGYMIGAAILTPDLWIEPLGALVKTGPAIVLMLVALLTLDKIAFQRSMPRTDPGWNRRVKETRQKRVRMTGGLTMT